VGSDFGLKAVYMFLHVSRIFCLHNVYRPSYFYDPLGKNFYSTWQERFWPLMSPHSAFVLNEHLYFRSNVSKVRTRAHRNDLLRELRIYHCIVRDMREARIPTLPTPPLLHPGPTSTLRHSSTSNPPLTTSHPLSPTLLAIR